LELIALLILLFLNHPPLQQPVALVFPLLFAVQAFFLLMEGEDDFGKLV
jgi:hypothetical protein